MISVSQATRPCGSSARTASRTESEIWSAILSGWPSVTDSEVNRNERGAMRRSKATGLRGAPPGLTRRVGRRPIRSPASSSSGVAGEDGADALGDRQLDPEPAREVAQHRRRRQALDDLADLGDRLLRRRSARDQLAGAAVAAGRVPARDDQVAHAGEPGERLRAGAARLAEPRHLDEAAGDSAAFALSPSAEAVDAAGGERDHVLRRRAELDADQVGVDVDAEDASS